MTEHHTRDGGASRPQMPPPQRASGTVRGSDLRSRARRQTPVGWPLFGAGLVIGAIAVAWLLGAGSSNHGPGTAAASRSPVPTKVTSASTAASTTGVSSSPVTADVPSLSPSQRPVHATPTSAPSVVAQTPEPTQPPPSQPNGLTIVFPTDGEVLHDRQFNVVGTGPAGATVTRDIPLAFDDHVAVQPDGTWLMPVSLAEGNNTLRFRIGDDHATEWVLNVTYAPGG